MHYEKHAKTTLPSFTSIDAARQAIFEAKRILSYGGFNLTKFVANDPTLMAEIDADDRAPEIKEISSDVVSKALSIHWDVNGDFFYYVHHPVVVDSRIMRPPVLRQVSLMYDPLGLILPLIIEGRIIFQQFTHLKLSCDDPIPDSLRRRWLLWLQGLQNLSSIHVDRWLVLAKFVDGAAGLFHFCDASSLAYGACSYLQIVNKYGEIHVVLLMSRARLAPLKQLTIPRLELCAAVLAIRLDVILRHELDIPLLQSTFFTDS